MTKEAQIEFVNDLIGSVKETVLERIKAGKIPEEWDGYELRQYLADKFTDACYVKMDRGRKREYTNTVIVNNL
jgi:hypothetical protein